MVKPSVLRLESLLDQAAEPFQRLPQESLQQLLEAQMTQFVGAAPGERSGARTGYRAGHVTRRLATRAGLLELRVLRDRERRFSTELPDRYARSEKALIPTLGQRAALGSTAADVKAMAEALCGHALTRSTLELIGRGLDDALARFARRTLSEPHRCLILQARRARVRIEGRVRSRVLLMALGSERDGRRPVLGVALVKRATRKSCHAVMQRLKRNGLHGVQCFGGDDRDGLRQAVRKTWGHGLLAPSRGALVARRAERSTARDARSDSDRDIVAAPAIAHALPGATDRPEVLAYAARPQADRPEAHRATKPDPRARAHGQRSKMAAALAATVGAVGLLFWGMGPAVEAPQAIVSAAVEVHAAPRLAAPAPAVATPAPATPPAAITAPMRSRFQLSGVAAATTADGPGIALIGIDGGSPQVFRVGATVEGGLVLKGVTWDRATLGQARGPATLVLDVTAPAAPSRTAWQAAAAKTWAAAGGLAEPTQSPVPDSGSTWPTAVAMGDTQPTAAMTDGMAPAAASNLDANTASEAQALASSPPVARRHRARRLNAPR